MDTLYYYGQQIGTASCRLYYNWLYSNYAVSRDKLIGYFNHTTPLNYHVLRLKGNDTTSGNIQMYMSTMTHIIDNVYLGNAFDAVNYYKLSDNNIKKIINVTKDIQNYYPEDIDYLNIEINDTNNDTIDNNFIKAYDFICDSGDCNILIHCFAGRSRSVSIVAHYLINKHNMDIDEAILFIKNKRPFINPNINFIKELSNTK